MYLWFIYIASLVRWNPGKTIVFKIIILCNIFPFFYQEKIGNV